MRHIDEGALHDVELRSILSQQGRELPGSLPHLRPAGEGGDVGADPGPQGRGDDDEMWLPALPSGSRETRSHHVDLVAGGISHLVSCISHLISCVLPCHEASHILHLASSFGFPHGPILAFRG